MGELLQPIEEELGEEEVPQVVRSEVELEAVLRDAALTGDAGVVDEERKRDARVEHLLRRFAHRRERREVELQELDVVLPALALDGERRLAALLFAPACDEDVRATPRHLERRRASDSGVRAGDEAAFAF